MAITQLVFIVLFKFGVLIAPLWIILLPSMLIVAYVVIFVIGEILSIEAKYRQKWSFIKHYDKLIADTKRLYKENKVPLLIVKKAKRHGEFVILSLDDFIDLIKDDFKE